MRTVPMLLVACLTSTAWGMGGPDGVELRVQKGPTAGDVTLQWTGGSAPFGVFRATSPADVVAPGNHLGQTSGAGWVDAPPPGTAFFYLVQGTCTYAPPEICDGLDNDCDPSTADGSEDPNVGTACDGADLDLCLEGMRSCSGGSLACSDVTGTTVETCSGSGMDENCDGSVDEGFPRNDSPLCTSGLVSLGTVSGDTGVQVVTYTFYNEEWASVQIRENSDSQIYLSASVQLYSPPGTDFDLYVHCLSCGGSLAGSSTAGGLTGHYDIVHLRREDRWFPPVDDTFQAIIEVRHFNSNVCAYWQLTVTGNTTVSTVTCGP